MKKITAACLLALIPARCVLAESGPDLLPHSFLVAEATTIAPTPWGTGGENPDEPSRHAGTILRLRTGLIGLAIGGVSGAIAAIGNPALHHQRVVAKKVALWSLYGALGGFALGFIFGGE